MGVFNRAIPDINLNDKDEPIAEYAQPVYIDDMFDPLFNKDARAYLKEKYKYPIYSTLAGFAEGLDNALVPSRSQEQWGIMGPGMGILSNFGRTMDKAGDFLIGGVTEGINAFDRLLGADVEVNNPLKEIFVNDEDYSGQRLLASMANSMSKLAGDTIVDESDFRGPWAIPATGLELALDPGILGGSVARRLAPEARNLTSKQVLSSIGENIGNDNFRGAVGNVAQLLSNYDDIMTRVAIDYAAPGMRPLVKKFIGQIRQTLGNASAKDIVNVEKEYINRKLSGINPPTDPTINQTDINVEDIINTIDVNVKNIEQLNTLKTMLDEVISKTGADFKDDILTQNTIKEINEMINRYNILSNKELLEKINLRSEALDNEIKNLNKSVQNQIKNFRQGELEDIAKTFGDAKKGIPNLFKDKEDYYIKDEQGNQILNPKYQLNNAVNITSITDALADPIIGGKLREDINNLLYNTELLQETTDNVLRKQLVREGAIDLGNIKEIDLSPYLNEDGITYDVESFVDDITHGVVAGTSNDDIVSIVNRYVQNLIDNRTSHHPSFSLDMSTASVLNNIPETLKLGQMIMERYITKAYPEMIANMPLDNYPFANVRDIISDIVARNKLNIDVLEPDNINDILNKVAENLNRTQDNFIDEWYDYVTSKNKKPIQIHTKNFKNGNGFDVFFKKDINEPNSVTIELKPKIKALNEFAGEVGTFEKDVMDIFIKGTDKNVTFKTKGKLYPIIFNRQNIFIKNIDGTRTPLKTFIKNYKEIPYEDVLKKFRENYTNEYNTVTKALSKTKINDLSFYIMENQHGIYLDYDTLKDDLNQIRKDLKAKYKKNAFTENYDNAIKAIPEKNNYIVDIDKYRKILKAYNNALENYNIFLGDSEVRKYIDTINLYNNFNYKDWKSNQFHFNRTKKRLKNTISNYDKLDNIYGNILLNKNRDAIKKDLNKAKLSKSHVDFDNPKYDTTVSKQFKAYRQFVEIADTIRTEHGGAKSIEEAYMFEAADSLWNDVILPVLNRVGDTQGVTRNFNDDLGKVAEDLSNVNQAIEGNASKYFSTDNVLNRRSVSMNPINNIYYYLANSPDFLKNADGTIDVEDFKKIINSVKNTSVRIMPDTVFKILDANNLEEASKYWEVTDKITKWIKDNVTKKPIYETIISPPLDEISSYASKMDIYNYAKELEPKFKRILNDLENTSEYGLRELKYETEIRNKLNIIEKILKDKPKFINEKINNKDTVLGALHDALVLKNNKDYKGRKKTIRYEYVTNKNIYMDFDSKSRTPLEDSILRYIFGSLDKNNIPLNGGMQGAFDRLNQLVGKGTVTGEGVLPFIAETKIDAKLKADDAVMNSFKEMYEIGNYKQMNKLPIDLDNPKNMSNDDINNLSKSIRNRQQDTVKYINEANAKIKDNLIKLSEVDTNKFLEYIDNPPSYTKDLYTQVFEEVLGKELNTTKNTAKAFGNLDNQINQLGDDNKWNLYTHYNKMLSYSTRTKAGEANWLKNSSEYKNIMNMIENYKKSFKNESDYYRQLSEYANYMDDVMDDIISGDNFLEDFVSSGLLSGYIYKTQKEYNAIYPKIAYNVKQINDFLGHNLIKIDTIKVNNGYNFLRYYIDINNKKALKDLNKLTNYKFNFKDIDYHKGKAYEVNSKYNAIAQIYEEARTTSNNILQTLGFESLGENYFKHTLIETEDNAAWLNNVLYKDLNLDKIESLSDFAYNAFNLNGTFRVRPQTRRLHGFISAYNNAIKIPGSKEVRKLFSTNPEYIIRSQLSEGILKNANVQNFLEFFRNDEFKIKNFVKDITDLKDILFAKDINGKIGGNVDNLELVIPKYNEYGKLTGFKRFNKFNDFSLNQAINNPDTVLIPTNVLANMDRILRKDAKMANRFYRFFNKLTLPFKYSILCNPGFLLGNISDAGLKILITQSEKYGTSIKEEASRLAKSAKQIMMINNNFDNVYNKYISACDTLGVKLSPEEKIPSLIINNKIAYNKFNKFVEDNSNLFTPKDKTIINAYLFLNRKQVISVLGRNSEDFVNTKHNANLTEYEDPTNLLNRIIKGKMNYDSKSPSSWGVFMNNPLINAVMKKSEQIESLVRSTAFYNDLIHHYGSEQEVFRQINNYFAPKDTRIATGRQDITFGVNVGNALNTSNTANFDYENVTDFMDIASTVIPFPTFFIKNIGYWLDLAMNNPQILDKAIRIQQGLWSSVDEEELKTDEFKAEALGRGAIPMDVTGLPQLSNFFRGIYKPAPLNSLFGMFNLLQDPIPNVAYRLNPLLSPITSQFQDSEDVRYRPYNMDQYQKNIKKGDEEFNTLTYMFHRLNPYDRPINNILRIPSKMNNNDLQMADITSSLFQPDF